MFGLPDFTSFTDAQLKEALDDFVFNRDVSEAFIARVQKEQQRRKQDKRSPKTTETIPDSATKRNTH